MSLRLAEDCAGYVTDCYRGNADCSMLMLGPHIHLLCGSTQQSVPLQREHLGYNAPLRPPRTNKALISKIKIFFLLCT